MSYRLFAGLSALLVTGLLSLSACSAMRALDAITPQTGYTRHADIAYGTLPRQTLDVYAPQTPDAAHSVVVFFYGGSWQMGDKALYRFVGQSLASQGITVVIADYRLYPQAYFPAYAADAAKAVAWTHRHIVSYGGDPGNLFVAGHSAGAHLAMLVTLDQSYLRQEGGETAWIRGAIGLAGPYDFLPLTDPKLQALFGQVPLARSQPVNFVRPGVPPVLLLHGDADTTVRPQNSASLADKLARQGNVVTFKTYRGVNHTGIVQALSVRFLGMAPTLADMTGFITRQSRTPATPRR